MKRIIVAVFFILICFSLYSEQVILQIKPISEDIIEFLNSADIRYDFDDYNNIIEIQTTRGKAEELLLKKEMLGFDGEIFSVEEILRNIAGYPSYDSVYTHLEDIASENSDFAALESLGPSTCNIYYQNGDQSYVNFQHDIWAMKISDNPGIEEDEPNVLFCGLIHAKETISLSVTLYILDYIVDNYGIDPDVTNWVDNTQIWFIPLMNPDGYKVVYDNLQVTHRKNMRDNNNNDNPDASSMDGVDLNRNFGYVWGNHNASSNYWYSTYHGPYAFSEYESRYVRDLIKGRKFFGAITYHSHAQKVLYPLGHLPGVCSYDHEIMGELATSMAVTIPNITGTGHYVADQAVDFGYTCQGTMGDWGYAEQRIFSFTIELANSFIPEQQNILPICEDNLEAALIFLDRVHHSTLTGNITDISGNPLVADVHVVEIDGVDGMTEVEPVRSDSLFGRYYRPLLPGEYDLVFSYSGYPDITMNNIEILADMNTEVNVTFSVTYVDSVVLSLDNNIIKLNWPLEPGTGYRVYSSDKPYEGFEQDNTGTYIDVNSWEKEALESKKFYKVLRTIE